MDKVKKYRSIVKKMLNDIANTGGFYHKEVQSYVIEDDVKGHYLLFTDGWVDNDKRFYGCSVHIEVKDNGKVYLHYDGTDYEIGKNLLESGISKNELVPTFQPPMVREAMGYAVS